MKFKLEIYVGPNAAQGEGDVAQLLRDLSAKLAAGRLGTFVTEDGDFPSGAVRNANGKKVGEWEVVDE